MERAHFACQLAGPFVPSHHSVPRRRSIPALLILLLSWNHVCKVALPHELWARTNIDVEGWAPGMHLEAHILTWYVWYQRPADRRQSADLVVTAGPRYTWPWCLTCSLPAPVPGTTSQPLYLCFSFHSWKQQVLTFIFALFFFSTSQGRLKWKRCAKVFGRC